MSTLIVGPFPPPTHGQSLATAALADALRRRGIGIETVDTSEGVTAGVLTKAARKLRSHVAAAVKASSPGGAVYLSANSGHGMWLSAAVARAAGIRDRGVFIHHHSYDHVRQRRWRAAALARSAGVGAVHIVLSAAMGEALIICTPEVRRVLVLNNAGLIDRCLLDVPIRSGHDVILGHLSNLTAEKGVTRVVDLAIVMRNAGKPVRLVLAGPIGDASAEAAIETAQRTLGTDFEYRGAVSGDRKVQFFADITHFVFPTSYHNEASPLVLMEAMAAGATCIATARGCIVGDLGAGGGVALADDDRFTARALAFLEATSDRGPASASARSRYQQLLREHEDQLDALAAMLAQDSV